MSLFKKALSNFLIYGVINMKVLTSDEMKCVAGGSTGTDVGNSVVTGATSAAGAALGALAGPAGAIIGGIAGGALGTALVDGGPGFIKGSGNMLAENAANGSPGF